MKNDSGGLPQASGTRFRSGLIRIVILAVVGGVGSLLLVLNGQAPLLSAVPFVLCGIAATLVARRLPARSVEAVVVAPGAIPGATEAAEERRARQRRIDVAWMSMRAQWIVGSHALMTFFVAGSAGIMVAAGGYFIAFPIGLLYLGLTWRHWRAGWKFHRSIDGMVGVSTNWPPGTLSPADRRFLTVLASVALAWFIALEFLALLARQGEQAGIIAVTLAAISGAIWLELSRRRSHAA
jgi:hypothetical protein